MAAGGTTSNVLIGPGRLYYAPLGTTEPASCSAALPSAWISVGYTEAGSSVEIAINSEAIEVAEELDPIRFTQTQRMTKLSLEMAETTKKRLALALGAGAAYVDDTGSIDFPDPALIVGVMLVWDSDEAPSATNRRWIFRQCTPTGSTTVARKKAPDKSTLPVTFDCAKPSAALASVRVFPNASGQV